MGNSHSEIYYGIDPGQKGAIGRLIEKDGEIIDACTFEIPEHTAFVIDVLVDQNHEFSYGGNGRRANAIVLERVHAMPAQGVSSVFTFGEGYGKLKAAIEVAEFIWDGGENGNEPPEVFNPTASEWTKYIGIQVKRNKLPKTASDKERKDAAREHKKAVKELHIQKAQELFPNCSYAHKRKGTFKGDDNHADALLLAWYGYKKYKELQQCL